MVNTSSATSVYLMLSQKPGLNTWTANPDFDQAIRLTLDRRALASAAGDSAIPLRGLIPNGITGHIPVPSVQPASAPTGAATAPTAPAPTAPTASNSASNSAPATGGAASGAASGAPATTSSTTDPLAPDLTEAKAALARSGYKGQQIKLTFEANAPIQSVPTSAIAGLIRAQLAAVGVNVVLDPRTNGSALSDYRAGKVAFGLFTWTADYLDPESYFAFAPGGVAAERAGWPLPADSVAAQRSIETQRTFGDERGPAFILWQGMMNARSPFVVLFEPSGALVHGSRVHGMQPHPVWGVDLASVS